MKKTEMDARKGTSTFLSRVMSKVPAMLGKSRLGSMLGGKSRAGSQVGVSKMGASKMEGASKVDNNTTKKSGRSSTAKSSKRKLSAAEANKTLDDTNGATDGVEMPRSPSPEARPEPKTPMAPPLDEPRPVRHSLDMVEPGRASAASVEPLGTRTQAVAV